MANPITTIEQLMALTYGRFSNQFVTKDAPTLTSTTGVYNPVFGADVWSQLNTEANIFGALPKYPWTRSGWRAVTARGTSGSGGGVAEDGALPDTVKSTKVEISTKPKSMAHNFGNSDIQEILARESQDDNIGDMERLKAEMGDLHKEDINIWLMKNVATAAGNNFESIDRVVSSAAEATGCSDVSVTAGDIYTTIDRSEDTWADATVLDNDNTDRNLSMDLCRSLHATVLEKGANPTMWVTGYDTNAEIQGIEEAKGRYLKETVVQMSVNGIQTLPGQNAGFTFSSLLNLPIIISKDTAKDTLSRIYLLDTSDPKGLGEPRLGLKMLRPTMFFGTGMFMGNPFALNKMNNEGMFVTRGELVATAPAFQGKIRDLK